MATVRGTLFAVLLWTLAGCAGTEQPDLQPGERPAADSVEAGLWMVMEEAETRLRTSGKVIQDPELQAYVQDITCRLAGDHCPGIRTYVVRQPHFNASMAPNGFMTIWSGLMLRCEDEAQLATVLGHEIAHYLRRHTLQRFETVRNTAGAAQVFAVATAAAGVPMGNVIGLAALGYLGAYSRDQEREADKLGLEAMAAAGYDPQAAPQIWRNLVAEREAADKETPDPFLATHPPAKERMETLAALAEESGQEATVSGERFHVLVARHRADWLEDEVDLGHFAEIQAVLERLKEKGHTSGVVWYYLGEVVRRQPGVEDKSEAIVAYGKALEFDDAPAVTYRSLGLLLAKAGDAAGARSAYESYLERAPDADDREMIRFYMKQLEQKS